MLRLAFILIFFGGPASAYYLNGEDLFGYCKNPKNRGDEIFCTGYITGIADMVSTFKGDRQDFLGYRICTPVNANSRQIVDVIKLHLDQNPQERHKPAILIILGSLEKAFPCS